MAKHGIDFPTAVRLFDGPVLHVRSDREGEERWKALGDIEDSKLAAVYAVRSGARRIISARRANEVNDESAVRYTRDNLPESRTDWAQLRALTEEDIEAKALSDSDNPPWTKEELRNAALVMPEERTKVPISIRLDADVLEFFKASGPRYQGRINAVLRSYVRSKRRQA